MRDRGEVSRVVMRIPDQVLAPATAAFFVVLQQKQAGVFQGTSTASEGWFGNALS